MEYPAIAGSTLAEINQRFAIGAEAEKQWEMVAAAALKNEATTSGVESTDSIGPLHKALLDAMVRCASIVLRTDFERQFPPQSVGRPGIDMTLRLIVVFLVNEERKIDPTIKHARALKHVAQLLGPEVTTQSVRSAYDRGRTVLSVAHANQDQLALLGIYTVWEVFREFWEEHKKSEKYAKDRSVCQSLRGRRRWWEMQRRFEWAK